MAIPSGHAVAVRVPIDVGADVPAPSAVAATFAEDSGRVFLSGEWMGGGAIITSRPLHTVAGDDPFSILDQRMGCDERHPVTLDATLDATLGGGWFGWLGYGLAAGLEPVPDNAVRPAPMARSHLAYHDHLLRYDAGDGRWWFEALPTAGRADALEERRVELTARVRSASVAASARDANVTFRAVPGRDAYGAAVERCLDYIHAGDVYQVNMCVRLEAETGSGHDPFQSHLRAVRRLAPRRAAFVDGEHGTAVGSLSPELFLSRSGRALQTSPIKGTAPAGTPPSELSASAKDRAENLMIVDLMRNDLGRVCTYGSVRVPDLWRVEAHAGVWHLVSDVHGTLREGVADGELLRATFPPGSVTGAPKVRAMQIIGELEPTGREVYTGAIGFASAARAEWNVAIRTFEHAGPTTWLGVGGGIVADSDPDLEWEECLLKARPLVDAIGGRLEA